MSTGVARPKIETFNFNVPCSKSYSSTVAVKLANGPSIIRTVSPFSKNTFGDKYLVDESIFPKGKKIFNFLYKKRYKKNQYNYADDIRRQYLLMQGGSIFPANSNSLDGELKNYHAIILLYNYLKTKEGNQNETN